ncbi:hypothetical protein BK816_05580 [Boudabousia tangfeifanii]|uniref:tRNA/rRNA methyltransferase SpoU type domain-containing protein n=1 Tax=Boudabousia tangfeifanii TaxID=1912795 RepID=A0A1D9MMG9_9ACTO|nr:hypothetical protein BK816_05580 [Boudabousia tangfeifanii]
MSLFSDRVNLLDNPNAPRIGFAARLANKSVRTKYQLVLVEGPQAMRELLLHAPMAVKDIYVDVNLAGGPLKELVSLARQVTDFVHPCTPETFRAITRDGQGICAVVNKALLPMAEVDEVSLPEAGMVVILARIQDPGNVGTMIRLADAFGAQAVYLTAGTVDPTSPKVIRAAAGSTFHLPIITGQFSEIVSPLKKSGYQVFGTSGNASFTLDELLDRSQCSPSELSRPNLVESVAWVLGNEAKGMSDDEQELCDQLVSIPMYGLAESLNVASAAAILTSSTARIQARNQV